MNSMNIYFQNYLFQDRLAINLKHRNENLTQPHPNQKNISRIVMPTGAFINS